MIIRWRRVRRKVSRKRRPASRLSAAKFQEHKEEARALAAARLAHFNQFYRFTYGRVFIKNQKSRWGSCSAQGNLNFNYKIALVEPHLADYIIVHELCHLKQMNHSKAFWELVAQTIPDYAARRAALLHGAIRPG
jgi:predicted metal-dependent hydrolase